MKGNFWILFLLIIILLSSLIWNKFRLPVIFWGKTQMIEAIVYDIQFPRDFSGRRYYRRLKFFYEHNGSWYEGNYTSDRNNKIQFVGSRVQLKIASSKPEKYKLIGFFNNLNKQDNSEEKYYAKTREGHIDLILRSSVLNYHEFRDGEIFKIIYGFYTKSDTGFQFTPVKIAEIIKGKDNIIWNHKSTEIRYNFLKSREGNLIGEISGMAIEFVPFN